MADVETLSRIRIPKGHTSAMLLMMLYEQSGHVARTGGEVLPQHIRKLTLKLDATLHVARAAHQRVYNRKRGEASVHLVALPDTTHLRWC
jgi:hypothetical protein